MNLRHSIRLMILIVLGIILLTTLVLVLNRPTIDTLPAAGPIPPSKVRPQIEATWNAAILLAPDGTLWNWGSTQYTMILSNTSPEPQRLGTDSDWAQIACGWLTYALALKTDGSLWGWGAGGSGQLGTTNSPSMREPIRIGKDNDWVKVRAGASHGLALKRDGSLWGWGQNDRGQLADGTQENRFAPQPIGKDKDWRDIEAGHFNSFGLKSNGTLWVWGLGVPSSRTNDILQQTQIGNDTNWVALSAGDYHLLALKRDGTLWLRGQNASLVAADSTTNAEPPAMTQVGTETNWARIYSGQNGFIARKTDGSWWGCGDNGKGQLGIAQSRVTKPTLVPLPREMEPWAFDIGHHTALLLTHDGALWSWGERVGSEQPDGVVKSVKSLLNRGARMVGMKWVFENLDKPRKDGTPTRIWTLPGQ